MNDIDVIVAIVTYKSAQLTIECLRSIDGERSTPGIRIRAIVVDNASGDAPAIDEAVKKNSWSSWVTVVAALKNGGFSYGNNVAFKTACDGGPFDYFWLLNPDTVVRKGAAGSLVEFLESHPSAGIAGSSFENLDGSDWPIAFRFPSILSELESGLNFGLATRILRRWVVAVPMKQVAQAIDWVAGASMMIRREVFDAIGGFDENYFLYFDETDFCWRAKQVGFSTWYVPQSRVMHIAGQSTKVTERDAAPKRLPAFWFESRRRFFSKAYGVPYAVAADLVAFAAHGLGSFKRVLQGRTGVPHFLTDLVRHSALWSKNRRLPQFGTFAPGSGLHHEQ